MSQLPRRCGPCTACCTAMGVAPLDKPAGVSCKHIDAHGCGIYGQRPTECRAFTCAYLDGHAVPRPDKLGVVIVLADAAKRTELAMEYRAGALESPTWLSLRAKRTTQGRIVIHVYLDKTRPREVFGSKEALAKLAEQLKAEAQK